MFNIQYENVFFFMASHACLEHYIQNFALSVIILISELFLTFELKNLHYAVQSIIFLLFTIGCLQHSKLQLSNYTTVESPRENTHKRIILFSCMYFVIQSNIF